LAELIFRIFRRGKFCERAMAFPLLDLAVAQAARYLALLRFIHHGRIRRGVFSNLLTASSPAVP
jgi:hypothetical protein